MHRLNRAASVILVILLATTGCNVDNNPKNFQVVNSPASVQEQTEIQEELVRVEEVAETSQPESVEKKDEWDVFRTVLLYDEDGFSTDAPIFMATPQTSYRFGKFESGTGFELIEYGYDENNWKTGYMIFRLDGMMVKVYPMAEAPNQSGLQNTGRVYYHDLEQLSGSLKKFYAYIEYNSYWMALEIDYDERFDQDAAISGILEAADYFTFNSSLTGLYSRPWLKVKIGEYTWCASIEGIDNAKIVVNHDNGDLTISSNGNSFTMSLIGEQQGYKQLEGYNGIYYTFTGDENFANRLLRDERFCAC